MKAPVLAICSVLVWAMHASCLANGSIMAKVILVRVDKDGKGMVTFDQQIGGTPATCVNPSYANAFAFDANTGGGKAILATALTAKTTGGPVAVYGTGACSVYGGSYVEDWSYGEFHQ